MKHLIPIYRDLVEQSGYSGGHTTTIHTYMDTDYFGEDDCDEGEECEGSHELYLFKKTGVHDLKQFEGEFE